MARPARWSDTAPRFARVLARLRPALAPERALIAGALAALFVEIGLQLVEPWPIQIVIDAVLGGAAPAWLPPLPKPALLALCAASTFACVALRAGAAYASTIGFALAGNRALTRVREELFVHVQRLSFGSDPQARLGDWLTRIVSDVGILRDVAVTALIPLCANVAVLAGMLVVMLWVDARLAAVALAPLPLVALFTLRRSRAIQATSREQRRREGDLANTAAEALGALAVVRALSLESRFNQSFGAASRRDLRQGVRGRRLAAGLERGVDVLVGLSTALVLGYGALRVLDGHLSVGELVVFMTYQRRASRPVRDFAKYAARLAKATASGERVLELLDRAPSVVERPDAIAAPRLAGALAFRDVRFGYGDGREVLRGFSLEVAAGERVALVGSSGAGKSTLASLLLRLSDPDAGAVLVDGLDLRDLTLASLRAQIAFVPQDDVLFAASVRENIACGRADATSEQVEAAARIARVDVLAARLPEGLDTRVGERGATLSRGERQRISIARAVLRDAPILVLDEPMTALDEENERLVRDALEAASAGRTCLLITHDLAHAARCDRIALVGDGRVLDAGHPEALRAEPGRLAAWTDTVQAATPRWGDARTG